ncbi:hypothetical protein [Roseivivax sp. CAU 1761]
MRGRDGMHGLGLAAALLGIAAAGAGQGAAAQTLPAAECDRQAAMVMALVALRRGGTASPAAAAVAVRDDLQGAAQAYAGVVGPVADWVYSLPEAQLGPEVGRNWAAACKAR